MIIEQFITRSDNFAVLLHDSSTGKTLAIDAPDGQAIYDKLQEKSWNLDYLLITHHHHDHVAGITLLKQAFHCTTYGPEAEKDKIPGLDHYVQEGDKIDFGKSFFEVIATPGHTLGEICYYNPLHKLLFAGDTLFSLGCGRLFEGSAQDMFNSLQKLRNLSDDTHLFCGHEYSLANAHFALSVEPQNQILKHRVREIEDQRAHDVMTLPVSLGLEKQTNPFLRWDSAQIRENLDMQDADDVAVFAALRAAKDQF